MESRGRPHRSGCSGFLCSPPGVQAGRLPLEGWNPGKVPPTASVSHLLGPHKDPTTCNHPHGHTAPERGHSNNEGMVGKRKQHWSVARMGHHLCSKAPVPAYYRPVLRLVASRTHPDNFTQALQTRREEGGSLTRHCRRHSWYGRPVGTAERSSTIRGTSPACVRPGKPITNPLDLQEQQNGAWRQK